MRCDLCGRTDDVATYMIYPRGNGQQAGIDCSRTLLSKNYCDTCVGAARRKNVWRAVRHLALPTAGIARIWKFTRCSREEMGDLMVASVYAHGRDPLRQCILWPRGGDGYASLENEWTRERLQKFCGDGFERTADLPDRVTVPPGERSSGPHSG
jgi:hypothetical protein